MQNAPINALLPDALLMLAVVVAWLNDTFAGDAGRRTTYVIAVVSSVVAGLWFAVMPSTRKCITSSRTCTWSIRLPAR